MVHATVFRDLNDNGLHEPGEPLEKGALITTGTRQAERKTDSNGTVTVGGLSAYVPIPVGVDTTSLDDPMLVPKTALQVVVPRPGVPADVMIGLVAGGSVEGTLIKSGEVGYEGVDLELVDGSGKPVASARTDFDGFFLFERVAPWPICAARRRRLRRPLPRSAPILVVSDQQGNGWTIQPHGDSAIAGRRRRHSNEAGRADQYRRHRSAGSRTLI